MKLRPKKPVRLWPADQPERWPIKKLIPSLTNARLHSKADILIIAKSISTVGFTIPVLIDEQGNIIAGHGRYCAAKQLGIASIPVIVARGWTETEKRCYRVADNQIATRSSWDVGKLQAEMQFLQDAKFDLGLTGFDPGMLTTLMAPLGFRPLGAPETVPTPPEVPVTVRGDRWCLGRHGVLCGDSTKAVDVAAALAGVLPVLMVSDGPYGVEYDPFWRQKADRAHRKRSSGKVLNDDRADWHEAWALFRGDVAYVWHDAMAGGITADALRRCGFEIRYQIVWAKNHFALNRGDYHWQHEVCWYAVRTGAKPHWNSNRKQSTLWQIPHNSAVGNPDHEKAWGHGTQRPVECMRRPIEHNSAPGDTVYDPFLGSGTTLIAAEMMGRNCVGLELSPGYVDVIIQRWQEFTGQAAVHSETGETFDTLASARNQLQTASPKPKSPKRTKKGT